MQENHPKKRGHVQWTASSDGGLPRSSRPVLPFLTQTARGRLIKHRITNQIESDMHQRRSPPFPLLLLIRHSLAVSMCGL